MTAMPLTVLRIDPEFRTLIRPLMRSEYLQLEKNLMADGCRDPITVWGEIIVDGHNRYEICRKHGIPFSIIQKEFGCREDVIAWICANQLGRRNITEETRKFLIGTQYESEKKALKMRLEKAAQGLCEPPEMPDQPSKERNQRHRTADRIANENHISHTTVQKYGVYSKALETIGKKVPAFLPKVLSGQYKISHKNLVDLSKMDTEQLKRAIHRIEKVQDEFIPFCQTRKEIQSVTEKAIEGRRPRPSVKDMPAFDPDAEITGLALTVPSWASSINRILTKTDIEIVSKAARGNLCSELTKLQTQIRLMLTALGEGDTE